MTAENIIGFVIQLVVTLIFGGVAVWCFKSKNPVHFWSGSEVKPYEIEDIKKYNRANGIMWIVFTIPQAVAAIATIWAGGIGGIICAAGIIIGFPFLIVAYTKILKKYKSN